MVPVNLPGYFAERMKSGNVRHRVRVKGQKRTVITVPCGPEQDAFYDHYRAARQGIRPAKAKPAATVKAGTVGWLVGAYMSHLAREVQNGTASPLTLKQRRGMAERLLKQTSTAGRSEGQQYRGLPMMIPQTELVNYRDSLMATPGQAKNTFKFIKAMYRWAVDRGHCDTNPAAGITVAYRGAGGAKPWTVEDLKAYRQAHPPGTMAHLALTLFMFTACRIGDAYRLGPRCETSRGGLVWLEWQPAKAGSRFVSIPMLHPLAAAIKAQTIAGRDAYLLTAAGKPFASPEALRNRMGKWTAAAGLSGLSSHGIRKAAGHLLALHGATQYEIMAIHGHSNASTSQVYTAGVERTQLAQKAAARLGGLEW